MSLITLVKNPGCGRYCIHDRRYGFVAEDGCPVHDRPGYRLFPAIWVQGRPLLAAEFLGRPILLGLN